MTRVLRASTWLIALALVFLLSGCSEPLGRYYTVISDNADGRQKRTVEVMLKERVKEPTLEKIADEIHERGYQRTFIGYYVSGESRYMYWATTNYNPELSVSFIGSTYEQKAALDEQVIDLGDSVIGQWRSTRGMESRIAFYEKDGELWRYERYQDGSSGDSIVHTVNEGDEVRYFTEAGKGFGEYYTIGSTGKLQYWSENGMYYEAPIDK